jgi:hypothetical protein
MADRPSFLCPETGDPCVENGCYRPSAARPTGYCLERGRVKSVVTETAPPSRKPERGEAPTLWEQRDAALLWSEVIIPAGSRVRMLYGGVYHYAEVAYGCILDDGKKFSPAEWARKTANHTSRNAWRDLEFCYPGCARWLLANDLRQQEREKKVHDWRRGMHQTEGLRHAPDRFIFEGVRNSCCHSGPTALPTQPLRGQDRTRSDSMNAYATGAPTLKTYRFRSSRAFKAVDDGVRQKWVLVVPARELPRDLPLDANARVPNVIRNPTCREMRQTLLTRPELFSILNGGVICTASAVHVRQENNEQWVEITFDLDQMQGVVNGGHTYGTVLHTVLDNTSYAEGMSLKAVLKKDKAAEIPSMAALVDDDERLADSIANARDRTMVQMEVVAPVADELLPDIARARNLSQSVDQTALQNLAGKYEEMKAVLGAAPAPFGKSFVDRVVWKTNQEVPDDSQEVPVKLLIHLLALMNTRLYRPSVKIANEVYIRSGIVIREFGEAEGDDSTFYDKLTRLLPEFIRLYDHIYSTLPETDPTFPWADGKQLASDRKRRKTVFTTPLLARACSSKVSAAFVWPVFSAFRQLLEEDSEGKLLRFKTDPIALFEQMKAELTATIQTAFNNQQRLVQQVGKDKEVWLRLEGQISTELMIRERLRAA